MPRKSGSFSGNRVESDHPRANIDASNLGGDELVNDVVDQVGDVAHSAGDAVSHVVDSAVEIASQVKDEVVEIATNLLDHPVEEVLDLIGIQTDQPEVLPEIDVEKEILEADNAEAVYDALRSLDVSELTADATAACDTFANQISAATDEDLTETVLASLASLLPTLTEEQRGEVQRIVGDAAFEMLTGALLSASPKEIAYEYISKLLAGETTEHLVASAVLSVAYSRMSDAERMAFRTALGTAALGVEASGAAFASLVSGCVWAISDNNARVSAVWYTDYKGQPYTCCKIANLVFMMANHPVRGLDVKVFATKEASLEAGMIKQVTRRLFGQSIVGQVVAGSFNAVRNYMIADAVDAALERSKVDEFLDSLTRSGVQFAKDQFWRAVNSAKERINPGSASTPVAVSDQGTIGTEDSSRSFAAVDEAEPIVDLKRDRVTAIDSTAAETAFQRGQARRARTTSDPRRSLSGEF